ncbi:EAL domain-containing protein [Legionella shakespearei]|nr:EAL domain-containing protein [Legionella shakespearei]
MSKILPKISLLLYKHFKLFWLVLTVIALILALWINWNLSLSRSYKDISGVATDLSNNVDGFIEDLFQEVYTLPIYGKNFTDCKNGIYPYLEHITLNNPNIAGLTISDNDHKLLCSTLPHNEAVISTTVHARTILGPFKLSLFEQPVYLVQQKMGHYYIGIFVVASVLQNILKTEYDSSNSVALHNQFEKKNIIRIEYNEHNDAWILSHRPDDHSPVNSQFMFALDKLQSIEGVLVVVFENHKTIMSNLFYSELYAALLTLLISYFLYTLLKNTMTRHYSLLGSMKQALKNGEFFPEYQPVYDCKRKGFSGVEVLLRWKDNNEQIIMPDLFIPEAEQSGLIVPMTLQIVETTFAETQSILHQDPQFHLAINLSALHFTDPSFFPQFEQFLEKYSVKPEQIIFEVTERDLLDKNDSIFSGTMKELRAKGYSLAVDDYGTGHASISYLQHFPFNYLKIDKLFVQSIGTNAITESLNDAIIQMAKGIQLKIIAEGVETKEQANYLSENGVQFLQGWYFSKSLTIKKLKQLLEGEKE